MSDGQGKTLDTLTSIGNIAVPLGAAVASTYGPNYSQAARLAMIGWDQLKEDRKNRRLGDQLIGAAGRIDAANEAAAKAAWMANAPPPERLLDLKPSQSAMSAVKKNAAAMGSVPMPGGGMPGLEAEAATNKVRVQDFMKLMPKENIPKISEYVGAVARDNPEAAIAMIGNSQNFVQDLFMKNLDIESERVKDMLRNAHDEDMFDMEANLRKALQSSDQTWRTGEREDEQEFTAGENKADRESRSTIADKEIGVRREGIAADKEIAETRLTAEEKKRLEELRTQKKNLQADLEVYESYEKAGTLTEGAAVRMKQIREELMRINATLGESGVDKVVTQADLDSLPKVDGGAATGSPTVVAAGPGATGVPKAAVDLLGMAAVAGSPYMNFWSNALGIGEE